MVIQAAGCRGHGHNGAPSEIPSRGRAPSPPMDREMYRLASARLVAFGDVEGSAPLIRRGPQDRGVLVSRPAKALASDAFKPGRQLIRALYRNEGACRADSDFNDPIDFALSQ